MARRRTGERIGAALEGFAGGFLPTYFGMQDLLRRKLSDRHGFLTDVGGQISKTWKTEDQLEPYIQEAIARGMTREEAITGLSQHVPTEEQRGAEIYRRLGDDPLTYTRSAAERIAAEVGVPEYFRGRRALPSRPIPGLGQGDVTGAVTPPQSLRGLMAASDDFTPGDRPEQPPEWMEGIKGLTPVLPTVPGSIFPGGRSVPPIMAPLSPRPFVPGATGGTPLEWGGPQAKLFEQQQQEAIASQSQEHERGLLRSADALRQQLNITQEIKEKYWDDDTDLMLTRMQSLRKEERQQELERIRDRLAEVRADELLRMEEGGKFSEAYEAQQRRLAIISAIVNDRPEWFNRMDSEGNPRTFSVTRDWLSGALIFQDVTESFGGTAPYFGYSARGGQGMDSTTSMMMGMVLSQLTDEGINADPSSPEGKQNIIQRSMQMAIPPDDTIRWLEGMKGQLNKPPGVNGTQTGIAPPSENLPPPPSDENRERNRDMFERIIEGAEVPGQQTDNFVGPVERLEPAVPFSEYARVLGGTETGLFGRREGRPGESSMTINMGPTGLGQYFGGPSRRPLHRFLRQEGVQDWLEAQSRLDPRITKDLIDAMLISPEGQEILTNAWAQSRKTVP